MLQLSRWMLLWALVYQIWMSVQENTEPILSSQSIFHVQRATTHFPALSKCKFCSVLNFIIHNHYLNLCLHFGYISLSWRDVLGSILARCMCLRLEEIPLYLKQSPNCSSHVNLFPFSVICFAFIIVNHFHLKKKRTKS